MKKILICLSLLIILSGCEKKEIRLYSDSQLKDILIEYGKSIYESESFQNKEPSDNIYTMNLETLDSIDKDISMFLNRECNKKNTRIELKIVMDEDTKRFLYIPILECK